LARWSAASTVAGVDPAARHGLEGSYAFALIVLNALHFLLLYAILRLQDLLPWNPAGIVGMSPRLAFNTAASFVTNTNWQAYTPESQISYGAQMLGLTVHMFLSAATGIAAAVAVVRAFAGGRAEDAGQFLRRRHACHAVCAAAGRRCAPCLIAAGVPQTFPPYATRHHAGGAQPDHRGGAGGVPGSDQGIRHQRWRVLQRQLARIRSKIPPR
jgi:K+-transporting ATPase ATPase A chain